MSPHILPLQELRSRLRASMTASAAMNRYSIWSLLPKTKEDLARRARGHELVAQWTHGLMGRSPDHVPSYLAGMCMTPELFEGKEGAYFDHLVAYREKVKREDLFVCYLVLSPQSSRNPTTAGKFPSLRVVAQDEKGVVVHGMKSLGTAAVFSDEALIGCMMPLGQGQENEAITCAIPMNLPGTKIFVRKPYASAAESPTDAYFSNNFDESDAVMSFDNVHIPWERVFVNGNLELTRDMYYRTPAHIMGNHQANWRFLTKLRLMNGIAYNSAEMSGLLQLPAIQQTLGTLAAAEAAIEGLISAQIHNAQPMDSGYVHINRRYLYTTLHWCATNYYQIAEDVRLLLGGNPFLMPADASILEEGAVGEIFDSLWTTPGADARSRYRFVRLAWDFLGSEFASRHTQYERFYGGPPHVMNMYNYFQCPWKERQAAISNILDEIAALEAQDA
jgi:4-hydroxyphenylacetate 3-monooxygenase